MGLLDNLAASIISFVKIFCFLLFAPVLYFTLPFIFLAKGIPAEDDIYQLLADFYLVRSLALFGSSSFAGAEGIGKWKPRMVITILGHQRIFGLAKGLC